MTGTAETGSPVGVVRYLWAVRIACFMRTDGFGDRGERNFRHAPDPSTLPQARTWVGAAFHLASLPSCLLVCAWQVAEARTGNGNCDRSCRVRSDSQYAVHLCPRGTERRVSTCCPADSFLCFGAVSSHCRGVPRLAYPPKGTGILAPIGHVRRRRAAVSMDHREQHFVP